MSPLTSNRRDRVPGRGGCRDCTTAPTPQPSLLQTPLALLGLGRPQPTPHDRSSPLLPALPDTYVRIRPVAPAANSPGSRRIPRPQRRAAAARPLLPQHSSRCCWAALPATAAPYRPPPLLLRTCGHSPLLNGHTGVHGALLPALAAALQGRPPSPLLHRTAEAAAEACCSLPLLLLLPPSPASRQRATHTEPARCARAQQPTAPAAALQSRPAIAPPATHGGGGRGVLLLAAAAAAATQLSEQTASHAHPTGNAAPVLNNARRQPPHSECRPAFAPPATHGGGGRGVPLLAAAAAAATQLSTQRATHTQPATLRPCSCTAPAAALQSRPAIAPPATHGGGGRGALLAAAAAAAAGTSAASGPRTPDRQRCARAQQWTAPAAALRSRPAIAPPATHCGGGRGVPLLAAAAAAAAT